MCIILIIKTKISSAAVSELNEYLTPPAAPKYHHQHSPFRQQRNHQFEQSQKPHFNGPPIRPVQFSKPQTLPKGEEPSFMQRIAQWFFPGSEDQDLTPPVAPIAHQPASPSQHVPRYAAQPTQNHHQQAPSYYRHGHSVQHSRKDCNPCDKVPWTPIFKPQTSTYNQQNQHSQYNQNNQQNHHTEYNQNNQQNQHNQYNQNNQQYHQQNFQTNAQYAAPPAKPNQHYSTLNQGGQLKVTSKEYLPPPDVLPLATNTHHAVPLAGRPIALPNLSPTAIPPLFNAKPFNQGSSSTLYGTQHLAGSENLPIHHLLNPQVEDPSLSTNPYGPPVIPFNKPMYDDGDIQVIPSIPVAEFVSSVEYPPSIVQSPVIDIDHAPANLPGLPLENQERNPISQEYNAPESNVVLPNFHQDSHPAASTYNISVDNDKLEHIGSVPNYDSYGNKLEIYDDIQTSTQKPYFVTNVPTSVTSLSSLQTANNHAYETTDFSYSTVGYNQEFNIEQQNIYDSSQSNLNHNFENQNLEPPVQNHYGENRGHRNTDIDSQVYNNENKSGPKDSQILYLNINPPQKPFKGFRDIHYRDKTVFTPSTLEYTTDVNFVSTSMQPPSPTAQIPWENIYNKQESIDLFPPPPPPKELSPTKKPKQIQIIIPYMANSKPKLFINPELSVIQGRKVNGPGKQNVFLYGNKFPPASEIDEDFHEQEESKIVTATAQTQKPTTLKTIPLPKVRDILKLANYTKKEKNPKEEIKLQKNIENHKNVTISDTLPPKVSSIKSTKNTKSKSNDTKDYHGEMIRLQKNIDDWTEQEYSKETKEYKSSTASLKPSKKIPEEYLTTVALNDTETTTESIIPTTISSNFDSVDSELKQNITIIGHISNSLFESSVSINTDSSDEKNSWKKIELSVSPVTNEKVYVVTPVPWSKKSYNWPELKPSGFVLPKYITEKPNLSSDGINATKVSLPESGEFTFI